MAYIRYTVYPDYPEATEYSRSNAYGTMFFGFTAFSGSIGAIVYFVYKTVSLFSTSDFKNFAYSFGLLILAATIDLLLIFRQIVCSRKLKVILANTQKNNISSEAVFAYEKQLRTENRFEMKELAKRFFFFFFAGALYLIGLIGIIIGIYFICHNKPGILLLICAGTGACIIIVLTLFLYRKLIAPPSNISNKSTVINGVNIETTMNFCYKCGAQMLPDSIYCSKCGIKIKC